MSQISLTFPDGNKRDFAAGVTPAEVAASISTSLAKKAISATVDGKHWDLQWPIAQDASIAIHTMADDAQALELIRHDLAHIMARAVQEISPDVKVTIGPVRDYGWFYDFDRAEPFTPEDLGAIEARMKQIINARDPVRTSDAPRPAAHSTPAPERAAVPVVTLSRREHPNHERHRSHPPPARARAGGGEARTRCRAAAGGKAQGKSQRQNQC